MPAELPAVLIAVTIAAPACLAAITALGLGAAALRVAAAVAGVTALLATSTLWLLITAGTPGPLTLSLGFEEPLLLVDALSAPLLPFGVMLWLAASLLKPWADTTAPRVRANALAALCVLTVFLTRAPWLIAVGWTLSSWLVVRGLPRESWSARRVVALYLGASAALLIGGLVLLAVSARASALHVAGYAMVLAAVCIRKGIFPGHSWVPALFERGGLGQAALFSAPQLGAYVAAVLLVPSAPTWVLWLVGTLALVTAVYAAAVGLTEHDARRALGYLFMSESALVMVGLESTSARGVMAALCLWLSSGVSFAGLTLALRVLELRRGRLSLAVLHGGYERMPLLAATFLMLGLAGVGFPGTLGFLGTELLVGSAVEQFPTLGFAVVLATALNGAAVLRMYFSLFCGRRDTGRVAGLGRREVVVFGALGVLLLATGLAPRALMHSWADASTDLVAHRGQGLAPTHGTSR